MYKNIYLLILLVNCLSLNAQTNKFAFKKHNFNTTEKNIETLAAEFISKNGLKQPQLILYGNSFFNKAHSFSTINNISVFNYSQHCGIYYTNSAFGIQLATEILCSKGNQSNLQATGILLINNFNDTDYGLIFLAKSS